jgi:hypothetical protein
MAEADLVPPPSKRFSESDPKRFINACHIADSFIKDESVSTSVQLALSRQDVKERESSDDGVAGRMTTTARADIGARLKPDR